MDAAETLQSFIEGCKAYAEEQQERYDSDEAGGDDW